jgi:tetratricopeptide (TPR) repeat protein
MEPSSHHHTPTTLPKNQNQTGPISKFMHNNQISKFPDEIQKDTDLCRNLDTLFSLVGFDHAYDDIENEWKNACSGDILPLSNAVKNRIERLLTEDQKESSEPLEVFDASLGFESSVFPVQTQSSLAEKYEFWGKKESYPETSFLFLLSALQIRPFHFPLFLEVVSFLEKNPSFSSDEIFDIYEDLFELNSENKENMFALCRSFFDFQQSYSHALEKDPSFELELFYARFDALYSRFLSRAYALHESSELLLPEDETQNLFDFAHFCFDIHDFDSSFSSYKKILLDDSENIEALRGLAEIYSHQEIPSEAFSLYEKILEISPNDSDALSNIKRLKQIVSAL